VLPVGKRYESVRSGGWLQITERTPDSMSFERLLPPGTGHAGPHFHLDFTQTWEAVKGEGMVEPDGEARPFTAGERVSIQPGEPHRDPWNPGGGELIVRGTFEPCSAFVEVYADALAYHFEKGTTTRQDELPLIQIIAISDETDGQSFRPGIPIGLQRASAPLVKLAARLRGYPTSFGDSA
jgi:mannose-6-phosphate isomerase-like protein (cupin superfamily)